MTNDEIAEMIAERNGNQHYCKNCDDCCQPYDSTDDCFKSAMQAMELKDKQFENAINEIKANIIESRDNKEYYKTNRETTLNWILRLIDECCTKGEYFFKEYRKEILDACIYDFEQKKQQLFDKAMKVICNSCAQKVECEFNNWKTCSTKDALIKSMGEQL